MNSEQYINNIEKKGSMTASEQLHERINNLKKGQNNQSQKQNNKENGSNKFKDVKLSFDKKLDFEATVESHITRTLKLGYPLATNLALSFKDFAGCIILPGKIEPELVLYFKPGFTNQLNPNKNKIVGIGRNTETYERKGSSIDMQRISSRTNANHKPLQAFFLTPELKAALSRFVSRGYIDNNGYIKWNEIVVEQSETGYMNGPVIVAIKGISLSSMVAELFGDSYQDETDNSIVEMEYACNILMPLSRPGSQYDYIVLLSRLDTRSMKKIERDLGQPSGVGVIPMCRPDEGTSNQF